MELKSIVAFITVAEELNFRKAADRLNMTQPPLTRLISHLEEDLGIKLFARTTRSVQLTGAGLHLLKKGREILTQISQVELELRSLQKSRNSKLSISLGAGALHSDLPKLISSFKEQFPRITVTLVESPLISIEKNLRSAKVDLYIGSNNFRDVSLAQKAIQSQELGLLIPKDNPLSSRKKIQLKDLDGETLIFHGKNEHLGFQEEFLEYLRSRDIQPQIYYKKTRESCGTLVMMGKGLLLSTKKSAHLNLSSAFVPLADYSPKFKVFATWARNNSSIQLDAFLSFLEEKDSVPKSGLDGHLN